MMGSKSDTLAILIPAAGFGRRMRGADKLLEDVDGEPLLRLVAKRACNVVECVVVCLPDLEGHRADALKGLPVHVVVVPDAVDGMSASLRHGVAALDESIEGVMVLPADMPDISEYDLRGVAAVFRENPSKIVQATDADGVPGHPVVLPKSKFADFKGLSGDAGARSILRSNPELVVRTTLPDTNATTDLDTPEAWVTWRRKRGGA